MQGCGVGEAHLTQSAGTWGAGRGEMEGDVEAHLLSCAPGSLHCSLSLGFALST